MSLQRDTSGNPYAMNQNVYTRLNDYCGSMDKLGLSSVAPVYQPYKLDQAVEQVPVFNRVNYAMAPYEYNIMYRAQNPDGSRNCNCNNGYCSANTAYGWPVDKNGNPLPEAVYNKDGGVVSGYSPMSMVSRGQNQMVNQTCAIQGNCSTNSKYGVAVNK